MLDLQKVKELALKYFPTATDEEIKAVLQEILAKHPNITLEQIEPMLGPLAAKMAEAQGSQQGPPAQVSPEDAQAKMAALKGMMG